MPVDFTKCVAEGGRMSRVVGPNQDHGLSRGEYVNYCYDKSNKGHRGEVHQYKKLIKKKGAKK